MLPRFYTFTVSKAVHINIDTANKFTINKINIQGRRINSYKLASHSRSYQH